MKIIDHSDWWNLEYSTKYKVALGISSLIFFIFSILLFFAILKGIRNIGRPQKTRIVTQDLNTNRKYFPLLYFAHFFFIWCFLSLMVFLTPFVKAWKLWLTILVVQFLILASHFIKMYGTWCLYVQAILREIYIFSIVLILFAIQFTDQKSQAQQLKELKILTWVSTVQTVIFILVQFFFLLVNFIKFIRKNCFKKSKVVDLET